MSECRRPIKYNYQGDIEKYEINQLKYYDMNEIEYQLHSKVS